MNNEVPIEVVAGKALTLLNETLENLDLQKSGHGWHDLGLNIIKSALTEMVVLRQENKQLKKELQELKMR